MLDMLQEIIKNEIPSKHVVFDSWFSNPSTIINIKKLGLDVVGLLKNTKTIKYLVDEKLDMKFAEVLALIFDLLNEVLVDSIFLSNEQIKQIIDVFISKLPDFLKRNLSPKSA